MIPLGKNKTFRITAVLLILFAAGAAAFLLLPQLAPARFCLLDRAAALTEGADYSPAEVVTVSRALSQLRDDPRVTETRSLMLVREGVPLPESFLWDLTEYKSTGLQMDTAAAKGFSALSQAVAERFDQTLYISSAWRDREKQLELTHTQPQVAAGVDESEHQTGLALDVYLSGYAGKSILRCPAGRWINRNCARFGFIIRYPYYGTRITGLPYEPWHLRYVGAPHAEIIMKNRLTLEEYLASLEEGVFYAYGDFLISRQAGEQLSVPENVSSLLLSPDNQGGWIMTAEVAR